VSCKIGIQPPDETWIAPTITISWGWTPPSPICHCGAGFSVSSWRFCWDKKKGEFTAQVFGQGRRPDLDKYIHRPAYVLRKLGESDGIMLRPFVTDLNLSLELVITTPLKVATESVKKNTTTPEKSLTLMRICVVVWGPSGAGNCAFKRVSHRPITAASRGRPSLPSVLRKKMGICNSAFWTWRLLSATVNGIHKL
jgi:hypothetical protein